VSGRRPRAESLRDRCRPAVGVRPAGTVAGTRPCRSSPGGKAHQI